MTLRMCLAALKSKAFVSFNAWALSLLLTLIFAQRHGCRSIASSLLCSLLHPIMSQGAKRGQAHEYEPPPRRWQQSCEQAWKGPFRRCEMDCVISIHGYGGAAIKTLTSASWDSIVGSLLGLRCGLWTSGQPDSQVDQEGSTMSPFTNARRRGVCRNRDEDQVPKIYDSDRPTRLLWGLNT